MWIALWNPILKKNLLKSIFASSVNNAWNPHKKCQHKHKHLHLCIRSLLKARGDWTEYVLFFLLMGMGEYVEPSHVDISLRLPCDKYFMSMLYMFASTASTFETDRTVVGEHSTQLTHVSFLWIKLYYISTILYEKHYKGSQPASLWWPHGYEVGLYLSIVITKSPSNVLFLLPISFF